MNAENSMPTIGSAGAAVYSHAMIVWGGTEDERAAYARQLAMAILCQTPGDKPCLHCAHCDKARRGVHPDIIVYDHDEKTRAIYVDQIRALRDDAVFLPNDASRKVYIILHAGSMNISAQNALLKILEEPPGGAGFILTVQTPEQLLATVRSRCMTVSAETGGTAAGRQSELADAFLDALADPLKLTELTFKLDKLDKSAFADVIDDTKAAVAARLRERAAAPDAIDIDYLLRAAEALDRAKEYLQHNLGLVHITGMLGAALTIRNEEHHD